MESKRKRGRVYAGLYGITALIHLVYGVIFIAEKCNVLVAINGILVVIYAIASLLMLKAVRFKKIFVLCTVIMTFFLISHYIFLGPSFGFQYLSIGMVPFVYCLAYVNGGGIELARRGSIASFITLGIVSIGCTNIDYPLLTVSELSRRIIVAINLCLTFFLSIRFMTEFARKTNEDAGALENKYTDLEKSASVDALTGLLNRKTIESYIKRALYLARGQGSDFSLLMCDIDNFKNVNDTYGHDCGDQVLKNIANIIKGEVRPEDVVFRWGGEEILIVVNASGYIAKSVAERCRKAIEESSVTYNDTEIKVTITIGGVSYYQGATRDDLVNRADKNLYEGKKNGKNQVVM